MYASDDPGTNTAISFGPFLLFTAARLLERDGVTLNLGGRALDILITLVERPQEVISKQELVDKVWPHLHVEDSSLRFHIGALRKALGDNKSGARYVTNVTGRGYSFTAPVTIVPVVTSFEPADAVPVELAPELPPMLARMIGREEAVSTVIHQLDAHRFVSVIGPGGIGKTTVAVAVARTAAAAGQTAHFIDFGSIADPENVPAAVASAFGLRLHSASPVPAIRSFLRDRRLLLVLDCCEHVVDAVAALAEVIFQEAPQVSLLATSRESLRVEGEHVYRLPPLDFPLESASLTACGALQYPAVQLFMERANAHGYSAPLSDEDAPAVAEICRRLDGIAMAIELAAGRVEAFTIQRIADLLDTRFRLLWPGRRTAVPRQQTLKATFDWSYGLLCDHERAVLRRLSVFVGSFSLVEAQLVAGNDRADDNGIHEVLGKLVAKSLLIAATSGTDAGFRLLDTARSYLCEVLIEADERDTVARRHARYFADLLQGTYDGPYRPDAADGPAYSQHLDNARAALDWSFSPPGDLELGIDLAAAASPLLLELSRVDECRSWVERALGALRPDAVDLRREMQLQTALALSMMFTEADAGVVEPAFARAIDLAQQAGDKHRELRLIGGLHIFHTRTAAHEQALAVADRSAALSAELADRSGKLVSEWMTGVSRFFLGDQASAQRYCETASGRCARSTSGHLFGFGFDHQIRARVTLARVLWLRGQSSRALTLANETLVEVGRLRHPTSVGIAFLHVAGMLLWHGDLGTAETVIGQLVGLTARHALPAYGAVALGLRGELALRKGAADEAVDLLSAALDGLELHQQLPFRTTFMINLAEGLGEVGRLEEALETIDQAVAWSGTGPGDFMSPEAWRVKGSLLARSARAASRVDAEAALLRSLEWARRQSALAWELRTATDLARLWLTGGREADATALLSDVYDRFGDQSATGDLVIAGQILRSCHSTGALQRQGRPTS
jgi:predicted ATPase/DNA-binding winged helix-turn-helix (wHTH) protein